MKFVTLTLMFLVLMFVGCDDPKDDVASDEFNVETVTTAPVLDGVGGDAAWGEATEYVVTVGETPAYTNAFGTIGVSLTAVRTSTNLYIKAVWSDATESIAKNQWNFTGGAWETSGNEDRLFFFFDMGQNGTQGADCATMCHNSASEKGMWTETGKVDQWHWKAARTAPINHADDKYIDNNYLEADNVTVLGDGGQHGDAKTIGLYNDNKADDLPKYTGPVNAAGFLVLPAGETDADGYFTAFDVATADESLSHRGYWLNENADGSRADVTAYSNYSSGTWTVEFKRALNTGNADDVVFGSGDIELTIAVTDNAGGDHSGSAPFVMTF